MRKKKTFFSLILCLLFGCFIIAGCNSTSIKDSENAIEILVDSQKVFDGTPIEITATSQNGDKVLLKYRGVNEEIFYKGTPINAGTYVVVAYIDNETCVENCSKEFLVTINKASYDLSNTRWDYTETFEYDGNEKQVFVTGLPTGVTVKSYVNNRATEAGIYNATVEFEYDSFNYNKPTLEGLEWKIVDNSKDDEDQITINVTDKVYDGNPISINVVTSGEGAPIIKYRNIETGDALNNEPINAGTYEVIVSIPNRDLEEKKIFTIHKANYDMSSIKWNYTTEFEYDGNEKQVFVTGLPSGVTVRSYTNNKAIEVGTYNATVEFEYDSVNYNKPIFKGLEWKIINNSNDDVQITITVTDKVYDGDPISVNVVTLGEGTPIIKYRNVTTGDILNNEPINAGTYEVIVSISEKNIEEKKTFTIHKADYDMNSVKWNYTNHFIYDGTSKSIEVLNLPNGVTVKAYKDNVKTEIGTYTASVELNYDTLNYNEPIIEDFIWKILAKREVKPVQTSVNYVGDTLSKVTIKCDTCNGTLEWVNKDEVLEYAHGYYDVKHTSSDGVSIHSVRVDATAMLDNNYEFQKMKFTLNTSRQTASVKTTYTDITKAIIPATVKYNGIVYTVTSIDSKGFAELDSLIEAYVPGTITSLGSGIFSHDGNLTTVELDSQLKVLGIQMFMYAYKLTGIVIPEGVKTIPTGFLYQNTSITSINIPSSVTKIDSSAFYGCKIKSLELPEGLLEIGRYAFASNSISELTIPSTVYFVDDYAFRYNRTLAKVSILNTNTITIGLEAFEGTALRNVIINNEVLVNSIKSNTSDTSYLLAYLKNNDVIYIKDTINVTSVYINEMFEKITSDKMGYNAYKYREYTNISVTNMSNRVYALNSGLYGDEKVYFKTPNGVSSSIPLDLSMVEFFDTSTVGKKVARVTYKYKVMIINYIVLPSVDSTDMDTIVSVENFNQNYYVGESINLTNVKLTICTNNLVTYSCSSINVTSSMVSGFDTSIVGTRKVTFTKENLSYNLSYFVSESYDEKVTSTSFALGKYYAVDTTEETEHFDINIKAGSYLASDYKEIIEKIYLAEQAASRLKFAPKIIIDVNENNYPSCAGLTLYLTPSDLLFDGSGAFVHELAHALDYSQGNKFSASSVVTEGWASYTEYLTVRYIYLNDQVLYARVGGYLDVIDNIDILGDKIYLYDLESELLYFGRDEVAANSQYEIGARFFSYLDYRYGDYCGWMGYRSNTNSVEDWVTMMKQYYNNENLFMEMNKYLQAHSYKYYHLLNADEVDKFSYNDNDLSGIHLTNYYLDFSVAEVYRGRKSLRYKDLYINIETIRNQLNMKNIEFTSLTLSTDKNVEIELYDAQGNKLRTVTSTTSAFSLDGVSFIKLVGAGEVVMNLLYS